MIDKRKIEEAVRLFLDGIGEDPSREGLIETPGRVSRMCEEIYGGMDDDAAKHLSVQFSSAQKEFVLEKDISFYSVCEHHLLPFFGKVHVAYIPNGKVVGLSKLARTVEVFAKRTQIQEQMTVQIAEAIETNLKPSGVMVVVEAEHTCMTMRGIKKPGSKTVTTATRGTLQDNWEQQQIVLELIRQ